MRCTKREHFDSNCLPMYMDRALFMDGFVSPSGAPRVCCSCRRALCRCGYRATRQVIPSSRSAQKTAAVTAGCWLTGCVRQTPQQTACGRQQQSRGPIGTLRAAVSVASTAVPPFGGCEAATSHITVFDEQTQTTCHYVWGQDSLKGYVERPITSPCIGVMIKVLKPARGGAAGAVAAISRLLLW